MKNSIVKKLTIICICILITATEIVAVDKTSTPGSGNWNDPAKWMPPGVPAPGDNITIPAGSTVVVDGDKKVKNLTIHGTLTTDFFTNPGPFKIVANGNIFIAGTVDGFKEISATGSIKITGNVHVPARDGLKLEAGGNMDILGGGSVKPPAMGGGVSPNQPGPPTTIKSGGVITIDGEVKGCKGGNGTGGQPGGKGGSVKVEGTEIKGRGTVEGGDGGPAPPPATDGKKGDVETKSKKISFHNIKIDGDLINIFADQEIQLAVINQGSISGDTISMSTCQGGQLDLRDNSGDSSIIVAIHLIIIETTNILLDSGVALSQLTSPDPVVISPTTCSLPVVVDISVIIQGFYNSNSNSLNMSDTVTAYLRNTTLPFAKVDSAKSVIDSLSFMGNFIFNDAPTGKYYIIINHRNSIETWSRNGGDSLKRVFINSFNFITAASQAYGNNMIQIDSLPVRFGIYSGDIDQNGLVDGNDAALVKTDAFNQVTGYVDTDVTGDGLVDGADASYTKTNSFNQISVIRP